MKENKNEKEAQVKNVREKLAELIDFYEENALDTLPHSEDFIKTLDLLKDAQKEFDTQLFAILMFGPLKAGKSTLTNLLAGEYVSPTGFGAETTLRPSLIIKGPNKNRSIDVYEAMDTRDAPEELFNLVIKVLRGFSDFSEIKKRVRKTSVPWSKENLIAQLTKELDPEPLITVLNVPGGGLVTEHTALIDMPGLDGAKSNWEDSPVHKWTLEKADFLIFVQSSMAALNESTSGYLKEVYINSKKPPLYLVQNIMEAKHWRGREDMERDSNDQRRKAKDYVRNIIGSTEDLRSTPINLGKAYDAWNEEEKFGYLSAESGFNEFEATLKDILNSSRDIIKQENAVREVGAAIERCNKIFEEAKEKLGDLAKACEDNNMNLAKPKGIADAELNRIMSKAIKDSLEKELNTLMAPWEDTCQKQNLDVLGKGLSDKPTKEECRKKVNEAIDNINKFYKRKLLQGGIQEIVDRLTKKHLDWLWADKFDELNKSLEDLGISPLEAGTSFSPEISEVKFAVQGTPCLEHINEALDRFAGVRKGKNKGHAATLWDTLREEYKQYALQLQEEMTDKISEQFDDWIKETYKKGIIKYIEDKTKDKIGKYFKEKQGIEGVLKYIGTLESKCDELKTNVEKVQMEEDLLVSESEAEKDMEDVSADDAAEE